MNKLLLPLIFCIVGTMAHGQTPNKFNIRGVVSDTNKVTLPSATVMLLTPKDSALINFGRTNDKGEFEFKNVRRGEYLLKITYVGYLPHQQTITPADEPVVELGTIKMRELNKDLYEVVIKTARAPLSIKGDMIEYDASSFKVPPGSTVEDLLKKLPGVQVDENGNIKAQGQDVKKVTVDGKSFFGSDPKLATKNLSAQAVSKVQVFNDKSEQSKITGVDDGKKEKTVNLELKEEFKKGGFGKVTGGVGTQERVELKANYNKFNAKEQFSIIGLGNNTNQTGLSFDDYQDFRGSQSFSWGDEADFGFGSNTRSFYFGGDDGEGISIPVGGGARDRGFTKSYAAGINYNYDTKKTKFSSNYYFSQADQTVNTLLSRENFFPNGSVKTIDNNNRFNANGNHRASLRYEKTLDSLNTLIVIGNGRYGNGNSTFGSAQQLFRNSDVKTRQTTIDNASKFNSFALTSTLIYRHKFKKKGRNFAFSAAYNINNADGRNRQQSLNELFQASTVNDILRNINQRDTSLSRQNQLKSSLFYLEPLSKKFFWETFYNFSLRKIEVDRNLSDILSSDQPRRNDTLSQYYTTDYVYNRLGTSIRYSFKGLNISVGLAGQHFNLDGQFATDQTARSFGRVQRSFLVWVPNASFNYDLKNNKYIYSSYDANVREPSTRDLQPVIDNSNPLFIREGNPNLVPQVTHDFSVGYNSFDAGSFTNIYVSANYEYMVNQIVYNQNISSNLVTRTRPENISGGQSYGTYIGMGFPLKKTKATLNLNSSLNFGNSLTFINDVLNKTQTNGYNLGLRLDLTPSEIFTFYGNARWFLNTTKYSINSAQNQQFTNTTYTGEMNIKLPKEIYFSSRLNYRIFKNERFGFEQNQPILTLSVYKIIMKDKKGEIRLTANDVFNQTQGITQNVGANFISNETTPTLARYFMLSFTYNMRGVTNQMRKRNNW